MLWFVQTNLGISYSLVMVTITSYFVCCCFYIIGICQNIDLLIYSVNQDNEMIRDEKNKWNIAQKYQQMKLKLAEMITLHINVFE